MKGLGAHGFWAVVLVCWLMGDAKASIDVDVDWLEIDLKNEDRRKTRYLQDVEPSGSPTTAAPSQTPAPTDAPTTAPTTAAPTTAAPTTAVPTTAGPTTAGPTTAAPTTAAPTTAGPTTAAPTKAPTKQGKTSQPTKAPSPRPSEITPSASKKECAGKQVQIMDWDGKLVSSLAFNLVGVLIGILGAVFLAKFWSRPIINMSQKWFLLLFCAGVSLLNVGMAIMVLSQQNPSATSCMASFGVIEISFSFLIASLGMKEWRAWRVRLVSLRFQRISISDKILYGYIGGAVGILTFAIIIPWFATQPPQPDACRTFMCSTGTWFFVSWGYLTFLMLATTTMAFVARDVPSVGAESSNILYTSVFMLFCMIFLILVFVVASIEPRMQLFLLSFVVAWISLIYLLLIVFRKYAWVNLTKEEINALFLGEKYATAYNKSSNDDRYGGASGDQPEKSMPSSHPESTTDYSSSAAPSQKKVSSSALIGIHDVEESSSEETIPFQELESASMHGEEGATGTTDSVDPELIQEMKQNAFKIGETAGWEEFVDRTTGASFWIEKGTNNVSHTSPDEYIISM